MASVHKAAVDDAVDRGFDRDLIEEALVLCGGDAEVMRTHWNRWTAAREDDDTSFDRAPFHLAEFVAHLRDALANEKKEQQHGRKQRRRKRGRRR